MHLTSTITSRGQTTVPKEVRKLLGVGPRQKIIYNVKGDQVTIESAGKGLLEMGGFLKSNKPALSHSKERAAYRASRSKRYKK